MLLISLKEYLKNHHLVSFSELTTVFNSDPEVLQDMLKLLIRKGRVKKTNKTSHCGSKCVKCPPSTTEIYEWVG
jgi:putative ferrous iron transport protein C